MSRLLQPAQPVDTSAMSSEPGESTSSTDPPRLFIRMNFHPDQSLVSAISRLVADFCRVAHCDGDVSSRFYMAAHELAENMAKYSASPSVSLELELTDDAVPRLTLRTRNQISPERLLELERRLAELESAPDPVELYDRLIEETAPLKGVSGLGLARIRAEGLDLGYTIAGNELTLIVRGPIA